MSPSSPTTMPDFCNRHHPFHFTTALATLYRMGVDINRINIIAMGEHENYRGEIRKQDPKPGTQLTDSTRIELEVGFPSAVDYMPYQFFYGLEGGHDRTGEWESNSRRLMAAFDASIIRHLALATYLGLKYNLSFVDPGHLNRYLGLFAFDMETAVEDNAEADVWAALLPTFHFWAGNARYVERLLKYLLGYQVIIQENIEAEFTIPDELCYRLGEDTNPLGQGTILGRKFTERDSCYRVTVKGVVARDVKAFLPGGRLRRKLERVLEISMPGHLDYEVRIRARQASCALAATDRPGYLGYSSRV